MYDMVQAEDVQCIDLMHILSQVPFFSQLHSVQLELGRCTQVAGECVSGEDLP